MRDLVDELVRSAANGLYRLAYWTRRAAIWANEGADRVDALSRNRDDLCRASAPDLLAPDLYVHVCSARGPHGEHWCKCGARWNREATRAMYPEGQEA